MRSALRIPLIVLLLASLLPAAAHLDACAEQHSGPTDEICRTACCQPMTVRAGTVPELPPSLEHFVTSQASLQVLRVPDSLFRPPEAP